MKKALIIISIILIILLGVYLGLRIFNRENVQDENTLNNVRMVEVEKNNDIPSIQTSNQEERTTPKTLIVYKIYYTKCKHYIKKYEDIDASLVNCNRDDFKEKNREWNIDKFSEEEIDLSKEEEKFCNEHYKLKLENNVIVIYNINEDGKETKREQTEITTEYLTEEDILKLKKGFFVYGKENLINTLEDYE